jgi:hypothetical protein
VHTYCPGGGDKANFWHSAWLQGDRPKDLAPLLFAKSRKKNRTVAATLSDNNWIRDSDHLVGFTSAHLREFITLWNWVEQVPLQPQ